MAPNLNNKKAVLFIIDGLGDLPPTPLQNANLPNFDKLASGGITGLMSTIDRGITPGSDVSHLQIFGYDPHGFYPGRGPLEALGLGIELKEGDIAFRANFATVNPKFEILDRRAGRIDTNSAKSLEKEVNMKIDAIEVLFKSSVEHRGALVLRGKNLSHEISDTDPHGSGSVLNSKSLTKSSSAKKTAEILNKFTKEVYKKLNGNSLNKKRTEQKLPPANIVLLRGAGQFKTVPTIQEKFGISVACVAGGALYKGIAKYVGMNVVAVPGATATKDTNLKAKGQAVLQALKSHDLVFLHVKACDSFGHDGNFEGKKAMLERIDRELLPVLMNSGAYVIITGDHSTPCIRKNHSGHEVPILIYGKGERSDSVQKFDEISCMNGGLGHIKGKDLMNIIIDIIERGKMYGS
ncbi:2,3-bisphosphoglycerate-independent phosphoglycerate mutase [Candidatus Micrarchaeota archaeon]|nr:2,3-bisphosphoglycerate-independent phosphoglycerate mutase [Candidatus Micrarchaeota archaeon]